VPEFFDPRVYGYQPPRFFTSVQEVGRPRFVRTDTNPGTEPAE